MSTESFSNSRQQAPTPDLYRYSGDGAGSDTQQARGAADRLRRDADLCNPAAHHALSHTQATRDAHLERGTNGMYTVRSGDCLSTIAERSLRERHMAVNSHSVASETKNLIRMNQDLHPSLSHNPDLILDGWHLRLPAGHLDMPPAPYPDTSQLQSKTPHRRQHDRLPDQSNAGRPGPADSGPSTRETPGGDLPDPHNKPLPDAPINKPGQPTERPFPGQRQEAGDALNTSGQTFRSEDDRQRYYNYQKHNWNCAEVALGMAIADKRLGRPFTDHEADQLAQRAGMYGRGWEGGAPAIARTAEQYGLHAEAHPGRFSMDTLDQQLLHGRSAVVDIRNITGNGHYIYIAGKTRDGQYIIGDPSRRNNSALGHDRPVTRQHLERLLATAPVPGFTAVW